MYEERKLKWYKLHILIYLRGYKGKKVMGTVRYMETVKWDNTFKYINNYNKCKQAKLFS